LNSNDNNDNGITKYLPKSIVVSDHFNKVKSLIKYVKKPLSIINYFDRYSLDSQHYKQDIIRIELKSLEKVLGFFTLDKIKLTMKLDPIKPYFKFNEMCISDFNFIIKCILKELEVILNTGYLNTHNLIDYPIINDLITLFVSNEDYINGKFSHESYKWLFNIIHLTIYRELIEYENLYKPTLDTRTDSEIESYYELKINLNTVRSRLDPSIRKSLQKVGITLIQNIEAAFDSEYVNINSISNKPLSFQIAQVLQNYIKIPIKSEYKLEKINPVTESNYLVKTTLSFDYNLIENIISNHINCIRNILYGDYDFIIKKLYEYLTKDKSIKSFETSDSLTIRLKESKEKTYIKLLDEKGYSLLGMLQDIYSLSKVDIFYSRKIIMDKVVQLINSINENDFKMFDAKENYYFELSYDDIDQNELTVNKVLTNLSRNRITISKNHRLSITYIYNNILIGHNTSADLSLLNDFNLFKDELDIVNKGMITIGKGFKYAGYNVQVRDTMLLAPAGQKSLASIGKLYNFDKINLTEFEITHMDLLLKNDKDRFMLYALKDSQITLKHAI